MYFCANEFEAGVNDSIFPGNEQQKVYIFTFSLFEEVETAKGLCNTKNIYI